MEPGSGQGVHEVELLLPVRVVGRAAVGVDDGHRAGGAGGRQVVQHGQHGRHADAGGGQQQGAVPLVERQVAEGRGHGEDVARPGVRVQPGGDLTLGTRAAPDAFDGDAPVGAARRRGQAVLTDLVGAVGQRGPHTDVLPRAERRGRAAVGGPEDERDRVGGLLVPLGDLHAAPDVALGDPGLLVEAGLGGHERVGHQPVDLVPGGGDLGGDGVTEHLGYRGKEMTVDDLVLVRGDAEGGVLVRDAGQQRVRTGVGALQQHAGEGGDGAGQRPLLLPVGLVAAVEQVAQQLGVGVEQLPVEQRGDVPDGRSHRREGGTDHGD
ncbi:hypothetical protein SROCM77S_01156 [Streptomyces rochei]